ncbi:hypothetical protein JW898_01325 [Candidatus Woesearchaeota archaeon]|nr:hypothetical protein [Candidatus Woesearchaeota archaeon]
MEAHTYYTAPPATATALHYDFGHDVTVPSGLTYYCVGTGCGVPDTDAEGSSDQTYYAVDSDGIVYEVNCLGNPTTDRVEGMSLERLNEMHTAKVRAEGATDITPVVTWGSSHPPGEPPGFAWPSAAQLVNAARRAGGWFNFWLGEQENQRFARMVSRWAGYDEDNPLCPHCVEWLHKVFGYDAWADMACRKNLMSGEYGTTFVSRSGFTSFDIEGERKIVFPCGEAETRESFPLPNGSTRNCAPYYDYKVSGGAVPSETDMEFKVYLNAEGTGTGFDALQDLSVYYDELTNESANIKLNRSGEPWSLSGPNMFVYQSYVAYDKACLQFTDDTIDKIQNIIPSFYDENNPYCNTISEAYVSQSISEEESGSVAARTVAAAGGGTAGPGGGTVGPGG